MFASKTKKILFFFQRVCFFYDFLILFILFKQLIEKKNDRKRKTKKSISTFKVSEANKKQVSVVCVMLCAFFRKPTAIFVLKWIAKIIECKLSGHLYFD